MAKKKKQDFIDLGGLENELDAAMQSFFSSDGIEFDDEDESSIEVEEEQSEDYQQALEKVNQFKVTKSKAEDLFDLVPKDEMFDEEEAEPEENENLSPDQRLNSLLNKGVSLHEALRDIVHTVSKDSEFGSITDVEGDSYEKNIEEKRKELHEILDNLDKELEGKEIKEVSAIFSSLLNIQSQLCIQRTDGVITIRTRLNNFFKLTEQPDDTIKKFRFQEITLIFTPEEVHAVRRKLAGIDEEHPMHSFFTTILDQAYDMVQYNELTGNLLIEMTKYFLGKLEEEGHGNTCQTQEFKERHIRSKSAFNKSLDEMRDNERIIRKHLENFPVLMELPKYLRLLIYIKLGLLAEKQLRATLQYINESIGKYARARSAVQFDFRSYFSQQHNMHLRQKIILKLHQDMLKYTEEIFEKDIRSCQEELYAIIDEIKSNSEQLDPNSPEYEILLRRKAKVQRKLEERRRKLDVVYSQERLVDVQYNMISDAIQRYGKNEAVQKRIDEQLRRKKLNPENVRDPKPVAKKKPSRMVMAHSRFSK